MPNKVIRSVSLSSSHFKFLNLFDVTLTEKALFLHYNVNLVMIMMHLGRVGIMTIFIEMSNELHSVHVSSVLYLLILDHFITTFGVYGNAIHSGDWCHKKP